MGFSLLSNQQHSLFVQNSTQPSRSSFYHSHGSFSIRSEAFSEYFVVVVVFQLHCWRTDAKETTQRIPPTLPSLATVMQSVLVRCSLTGIQSFISSPHRLLGLSASCIIQSTFRNVSSHYKGSVVWSPPIFFRRKSAEKIAARRIRC